MTRVGPLNPSSCPLQRIDTPARLGGWARNTRGVRRSQPVGQGGQYGRSTSKTRHISINGHGLRTIGLEHKGQNSTVIFSTQGFPKVAPPRCQISGEPGWLSRQGITAFAIPANAKEPISFEPAGGAGTPASPPVPVIPDRLREPAGSR